MGLYKLIRQQAEKKAIKGKLYRIHERWDAKRQEFVEDHLEPLCDTLENTDYVIPSKLYRITVTYSPKFKQPMPLICNVPMRKGIRIHFGTKPTHSRGCVLITHRSQYKSLLEQLLPEQENEFIYLEIVDAEGEESRVES